ncbi:MAG: PHP domain-containing protein [Candidatus Bipolaricaulota bacterium]
MLKSLMADLHIHTCLSPCGELEMAPRSIARAAVAAGIDWIAVADHNSGEMAAVMAVAAREAGLAFLYGMEVQTREDVHVLAYFDDEPGFRRFAQVVDKALPERANDPAVFGDQPVVDLEENIVRCEPRMLLNAVRLGFDEVVEEIERQGGLAVPAHVDREAFGLLAQLGFVPVGRTFCLVESVRGPLPPGFGDATRLCSSDAHRLEDIGRRVTRFTVAAPTLDEMRRAAAGEGGRSAVCHVRKEGTR